MKVIIPVAGIGSKLRPHTHTQPKALVPVAGKPILSHIVDSLIEAGQRDFIFIIGYLGDKIEEYIKASSPGITTSFGLQEPREGTAHAVWLTRDKIDDNDELIIALGDTIFDVHLKDVLATKESALGVKKVNDPRNFGVVELDEEGCIRSLVEKPPIPKSNLALVGIYKIRESRVLMEAIDHIISKNHRTQGEFHLTDAIMEMISRGSKFKTFPVENWYDCGNKESLLETNAVLLKKNSASLHKYSFENTIIIDPVSFSENCQIRNSIIGPNVAIAENAVIRNSIVRNSILGAYSQLDCIVLDGSVIGNDASLRGKSNSVNIGDNTEIDFNS